MKAIEIETTIPVDGKLPDSFQEVFGRKARVIVLFEEEATASQPTQNQATHLMALAGKIQAFQTIEDPVAWQHKLRDEWEQ